MNRLTTLLIVSLCAGPALAQQTETCWNRDVERMDFYTNPPSRGDNTFFSFTVSGTANVTMLYPGTKSMTEFPISLYELRTGVTTPFDSSVAKGTGYGCSNSFLNALEYFMPTTVDAPAANPAYSGRYNNATTYPEPEYTYAGGGGLNDCFVPSDYNGSNGWAWQYKQWAATTSSNGKVSCPKSASPPTGADTIINQCTAASGGDATALTDCEICLGAAGFAPKGYWINYKKADTDTSGTAFLARGNWLNFYPPKWALLRLAYKRLVNGPLLNPLREGIVTNCTSTNSNYSSGQQDMTKCAGQGMFRLQKMLPQSCSGGGRPNQRIASVDQVTYSSNSNPLAEMLFNTAWSVSADSNSSAGTSWMFNSYKDTYPSGQSGTPSGEQGVSGETGAKDGFCPGCNAGFSVLFSDGRGVDGLTNCSNPDGGAVPAYCIDPYDGGNHNSYTSCYGGSPGLGIEKDGDDFIKPDGGAGSSVTATTAPGYTVGSGTCPNDYLDDVAAWMYGNNMLSSQAGTNLRLYTIGIGDNYFGEQNILKSAASAGKGMYVEATDFASLERNINKVFLDIISNATSFSVAAITTVQTRGTTFAFIPRFRPLGGAQWEGRLYRFRLFNEFAAGCGPAELTGNDGGPVKDSLNPNGNASCNDLYLQDADGGYVGEDDGGTFVLLDTSQAYGDAGWPIMSPKTAANPIWEAASVLTTREQSALTGGGTPRAILTVPLDGGDPSGTPTTLITYNDFSDAGVSVMTNYMKLGGVNSDFCTGLSSVTRHAYSAQTDCGQDLMKFIDGQDVMRQNTDGGSVRPLILGDIFHSSPILVTPPAPTYLCETGIINQCVRTLYAEDGTVPATPNSKLAYTTYYNNNAQRQELLLVGANDGMLHAFQAGTYQGDAGYDDGTGQEVWAFIPPDMLPKLQRYALSESHNILVDGTPWVRDIWKDGSGASPSPDHQKQSDEFHTIAIIGEREGGRHYTALDITDTAHPPKFLWTFPPPNSEIDLAEGETWNDTTPNPPPIGPILMRNDSSGALSYNIPLAGSSSPNAQTGKADEVWVAAISGGYDPNLIRGRAVYIVDAYTGQLLFKYSRYDASGNAPCPGAGCDPRTNLAPVAAPVSLVDTNYDNFFDVGVFGDTNGNVHVLDLINPGVTSGSPALVTNWYGGLTLQQYKGTDLMNRSPFFQMAGARVFDDTKGGLRVYLGGGDRDQIKVRDTDAVDGGTCQLDNLRGCIRNGCSTVDVKQNIYTIGTGNSAETFTAEWKYQSGGTTFATNSFTLGTATGAGACSDPAQVDIQYSVDCSNRAGGSKMVDANDGGYPILNDLYCDFDGGNDAGEECTNVSGKEVGVGVAFTSPAITNSRFYSVKVFDPPTYTNHPRLSSGSNQNTYNTNTYGDTNLFDATDGGSMTVDAGGWYVTHANDQNEKTASAALLLGGCVAWNTEVPSVVNMTTGADGGQTCAGGTIPADTAYLYQANDDTGAIQCGLPGSSTQQATVRYQARSVTVTPQQPTPVVSLNAKTGQAGYSGVSLEPGGKIPLQVSVGAASVQGDVSWIDVSRNLHNCRHPADGGSPVCN